MKILITGGASGIGYSLTESLIKRGHYVYLCVHNENQIKTTLEKVKQIQYQDRVSIIKLDITNQEDVNLLEELDIDCLVNQAGIGIGGSVLNLSIDDIKQNFEVNLFSTLNMTKKYIKSRKNKKGKILITSSMAGIIPLPFLGSYCSTKASLTIFAKVLKKELKKTNLDIKIKLIIPGAYKTGFNQFMIENKEVLNNKIFKENIQTIIKKQKLLFNLVEKKKLKSIVNQMVKAIESEDNRLIYSAPLIQNIGARIYAFLFM